MLQPTDSAQDVPDAGTREQEPSLWLYLLLWAAWFAGFGVNLVLIATTWGDRLPPGCSAGAGCGVVLQSEYSRIFSVPLTSWSLGYYLVVALLLLFVRYGFQLSLAPPLSLLLSVISAIGLAAGIWSIYVMAAVLGEFCIYCLGLHLANFTFFGLALVYGTQDWRHRQFRRWKANVPPLPILPIAYHVIFALLIVTGQIVFMNQFHSDAPAVLKAPVIDAELDVKRLGNVIDKLALDGPGQGEPIIWTVKGPRDAPHKIVTFTCFTCEHCKRANDVITSIQKRYPGQLRVDMRMFPLSVGCNKMMKGAQFTDEHRYACELSRLAIGVALADPEKFEPFVNWIYENQKEVDEELARAKASELVGDQALDEAMNDDAMWLRSRRDVELGASYRLTGVPNMFLAGGQVYGGMSRGSLEKLFTEQFAWEPSQQPIEESEAGVVLLSSRTLIDIFREARGLEARGAYHEAREKYQHLIDLQPAELATELNVAAILSYTWLLTTCGDDEIFDPVAAKKVFSTAKQAIVDLETLVEALPTKTRLEQKLREKRRATMKDLWARYYEIEAAVRAANKQFRDAHDSIMVSIEYAREKGDSQTVQRLQIRAKDFYARDKIFRRTADTMRRQDRLLDNTKSNAEPSTSSPSDTSPLTASPEDWSPEDRSAAESERPSESRPPSRTP
ncbi:MAG: hypothetical protein DWQ42_03885 [Planctomycetota bacterium]|nr:MAG: hypothetical protein DWQ42_03885 [Planctomycetota bacterium]REK46954.1 MAG: hypothetical protein DWQ46_05535 [Planctomycetota bacterium]